MAYLGKDVVGIMSYSRAKDTMTGDGSTTTLTLSRDPGTQNNVEIYMDGVLQTPGVEYTLSGNVVTFTTAPETGLNVVALSGTETVIEEPADNSVVASHLVGGLSLTDAKMGATVSASKLTGALPALDGSALTGMSSGINVTSASDPAIDTNHANGVGTTWVNTTSGEMFVCTDATTDANVWFNVGGGTGDVEPWTLQGTAYGYACGGDQPARVNTIENYSFTSDGNASDVSDLTQARMGTSGNSSATHGYIQAGTYTGGGTGCTIIDRFSFASGENATDVGDKTIGVEVPAGSSSSTHGYSSGGIPANYSSPGFFTTNIIDRVSFASATADSTDHGDLSQGVQAACGSSSGTHGYVTGGGYKNGNPSVLDSNQIQKFAFANNTTATDSADITDNRSGVGGASSSTDGYVMGGYNYQGGNYTNTVDKFSFASSTNSTDQRDLSSTTGWPGASSSTTHAYCHGGEAPSFINVIQKFAYANSSNGTDVGDLSTNRMYLPDDIQI